MKILRVALSIALFPFTFCFAQQPKYEFRAAWIATVDNIDWPSRGNYNTESQKAEFTRLLDTLQGKGMNVVIVQVRPATDAFYPSPMNRGASGSQASRVNLLIHIMIRYSL